MVSFRALREHGAQSIALFITGALVVAGGIVAVGYSRLAHVSVGSAAALLVVGTAALSNRATATIRVRRQEVSLAQLRGARGSRLLLTAVAEPCVVLLTAAVAGTLLGRALARLAVTSWLPPGSSFRMSASEWIAVGGALAVSLAVVVAVSWRTAYDPLMTKLDPLDRPRAAPPVRLFLAVTVILAAIMSVYQARQVRPGHADWVGLLSPALVGLAAGQIVVWVVAVLARAATARNTSSDNLGWFLTVRRLARRADSVAILPVVVAATVMAGVAANAWAGSGEWRDEMARMQTMGPRQFTVPTGALQAYVAAHKADPEGRWLMAISASTDPSGGSYRDVFVDSPRWDRVAGTFVAGTPVEEVSDEIAAVVPRDSHNQVVRPTRGKRYSVTMTAQSVRRAWPRRELRHLSGIDIGFMPLQFTVTYVNDHGDLQAVEVPKDSWKGELPSPVSRDQVGYSASLPDCQRACALQTVNVQGLTGNRPLHVTGMSFGRQQLLAAADGLTPVGKGKALQVVGSDGGLDMKLREPYLPHPALIWEREAPAALVTPGLHLDKEGGEPVAYGIDGRARQVRITGEVPALPILGRSGLLLDLGTALRGAGGQTPTDTTTVVVARADTPRAILSRLRATGVTTTTSTVQQTLDRIERTSSAKGTRLYLLIALFAVMIAAVSLVASTVEQRHERRTEAASLRAVGVRARVVAHSYRGEAWALALATALASALTIWLGCRALLPALPLVDPGDFGLPFNPTPQIRLVVGSALVAGMCVAVVVFLTFRHIGRSSPPRLLREDLR